MVVVKFEREISIEDDAAPPAGAASAATSAATSPRTPATTPPPRRNPLYDAMRKAVSKKKKRFTEDGFDLDLTYVTKRLVAMGFPARGREAAFRNSDRELAAFVATYHGADRAKLYNLCSEKTYPADAFAGRFARFPFDDHAPPPLGMFYFFCRDVDHHLAAHADNVALVHCKAGKGRTGVMISAYLVWTGAQPTAEAALAFYGSKRTDNAKGVTIPSQRRFVGYFAELVASRPDLRRPSPRTPTGGLPGTASPAEHDGCLSEASTAATLPALATLPRDPTDPRPPRLASATRGDGDGDRSASPEPSAALVDAAWNAQNRVQARGVRGGLPPARAVALREVRLRNGPKDVKCVVRWRDRTRAAAADDRGVFRIDERVEEEVRVTLKRRSRTGAKTLCEFWFHTAFVGPTLLLDKAELDKACKDKALAGDLAVEVVFGEA